MTHVSIAGFEMTVLGYEFPELKPTTSFSYDANWLIVEAKIKSENGFIQLNPDPCLLTTELEGFVRQLECFVNPQAHRRWEANLQTMEPYLKLHIQQDDETGLIFGAEVRADSGRTIQQYRVQWDIDQQQLAQLHQQLAQLSEEFPVKKEQL